MGGGNRDPRGLIVGNYCHDVLIKDEVVLAETLGGSVSFISAVLDGLHIPSITYLKLALILPTTTNLNETGFSHLLPRIGFLKASAEEAPYVDVDEARKSCCVVVTSGKDGCTVYWKDVELQISPFSTVQVDPTGAGDSFLGGLATGLVQGLAVPDVAQLGNFFGSLTVGQIGLPKFDSKLIQKVKHEVQRRKMQFEEHDDGSRFKKPKDHEQFLASLSTANLLTAEGFCHLRTNPRLHI